MITAQKFPMQLVLALCLLSLLGSGTGCFRASPETRDLRAAALQGDALSGERQIEIGVGRLTLGLARYASSWLDLPPEARQVLGSVDQAACSVYELKQRRGNHSDILARADQAMHRRNWERLVVVMDESQLVAVYVPSHSRAARSVRAAVLVLNDDQLVCASVRGDVRQWLELAGEKMRSENPRLAQVRHPEGFGEPDATRQSRPLTTGPE